MRLGCSPRLRKLIYGMYYAAIFNTYLSNLSTFFRDLEQTKRLFEKYKPTHVIHLAALGKS
jgi:hypothetical protein